MDSNDETRREGDAYVRSVLSALGAFEPSRTLSTTLQIRVTEETARQLDELVAEVKRNNGVEITRSDLVRTAITALVSGTAAAQEELASA